MADEFEARARADDTAAEPVEPFDYPEPGAEVRLAARVGIVALVVVAVVAGWLSYGAWHRRGDEQQRQMFLRAAREAAHDLMTISHAEVDADVQRILDLSTAPFHDDFAKRSQPYIEHIKQEGSASTGTVTEAGLESVDGTSARALVAVTVKLTLEGSGEQKLNGFRLRLDMKQVGTEPKVSNVEYIP